MLGIVRRLVYCLLWYLRPCIKWFLRQTTGLCELQRICYGEERGVKRTQGVETSLSQSRNSIVKRVLSQLTALADGGKFYGDTSLSAVDYSARLITEVKRVNLEVHKQFLISFRSCLLQIYGYRQLVCEVENLRKIQYSSENKEHEERLLQLWHNLMPDTPLTSRISKQWTEIGFQGEDPKTDFRGMGLLGLENLLYFSTKYQSAARHVLAHSHHPRYGYSFAIVGINLTSMAHQLLIKGYLKTHIYNLVNGSPKLHHFHQVYCYLFYEFDKFWISEKPVDIMEFNCIRDKFERHLIALLSKPWTILKLNLAVETV